MVKDIKKNTGKDNFQGLIGKLNAMSEKMEEAETAIEKSKKYSEKKKKLIEGVKEDGVMRAIIDRFNAVIEKNLTPILMEDAAPVVKNHTTYVDTEFSLAVKTKATDHGVQIGNWEIVKIEEGKSISYDIVELNSKEVVLENLKTYVSASAIVKLLNLGTEVDAAEISKFVKLDEEFDVNYQDAIRYGKKYKKTKNAIYEDRFVTCKARAVKLKETMKNNSDMIGKN